MMFSSMDLRRVRLTTVSIPVHGEADFARLILQQVRADGQAALTPSDP